MSTATFSCTPKGGSNSSNGLNAVFQKLSGDVLTYVDYPWDVGYNSSAGFGGGLIVNSTVNKYEFYFGSTASSDSSVVSKMPVAFTTPAQQGGTGKWGIWCHEVGKGWTFHSLNSEESAFTVTVTDDFSVGLSGIQINSSNENLGAQIEYGGEYYELPVLLTFDSNVQEMTVVPANPKVTINNGNNLKSVSYGSSTYSKFPATISPNENEFTLTARGKDDPVITINYEGTQEPVITNT